MSGWWFVSSASSATRFTKSIAAAEVAEAELPLERVVDLAPAVRRRHARRIARAARALGRRGSTIAAWSRPVPRCEARASSAPRRPELLCERVFRPLAHLVVLVLLPLRVPPPAVVLASAATGLAAAVELGARAVDPRGRSCSS